MTSIEEGRKRQQAKQAQPLDLEALREAVKEVIQSEMGALREAMQQMIGEELSSHASAAQHNQDLSAELVAIDAQLDSIRYELQYIRTATDLLANASQAQALINEVQTNQAAQTLVTRTRHPEEPAAMINAVEKAEGTQGGDDAAFPLPKDIKLPGRGKGPVPIMLEKGVKR